MAGSELTDGAERMKQLDAQLAALEQSLSDLEAQGGAQVRCTYIDVEGPVMSQN